MSGLHPAPDYALAAVEACLLGAGDKRQQRSVAAQAVLLADTVAIVANVLAVARQEIADSRQSLFECATIRCDPATLDEMTRPEIERLDAQLAGIDAALGLVRVR